MGRGPVAQTFQSAGAGDVLGARPSDSGLELRQVASRRPGNPPTWTSAPHRFMGSALVQPDLLTGHES